MADTPYREAPEVAPPRPPRRDPLAEETENPPHVRAAGAILVANALLGLALGAAQVRAGMPANLGLLTFAAVVDLPIGAGLGKKHPTLVRPAGLRRFAVLRLVCGVGVALLSVRGAPEGAALSVCASLAPLVLLARERARWRVRTSAVAQALVVLASVWFMVWIERGQRLFWGALLHARGEVGAAVRGRVGGGARPYTLEVPEGWYASREAGAQGDLHLVSPEWEGELQVTVQTLDQDSGPFTQEQYFASWRDDLDRGNVVHGEVLPLTVDGALVAGRVRIEFGPTAATAYSVVKADGDALVSLDVTVPESFVRANPGAVPAMLRSLRPHGRPLPSPAP
ncbi:MAG: hypothetical protein U0324_36660 [Polyangiales bacterium]